MNSATTRVLSALVLIPVLLALIWFAPTGLFDAVLVMAILICSVELGRLVRDWSARIAFLVIYIVGPLVVLGEIRQHYGPGALMVLIGTIIASDSGQYYTGRAFGTRKLAPVISPKKTVEGAIGGVVIGVAAAVALGHYWLPEISMPRMAAAGFVMAIAGIVGDLFESALKRRAGVKDSGNLIPGHGGLLDRIDSWLFAAPAFWFFLKAFA